MWLPTSIYERLPLALLLLGLLFMSSGLYLGFGFWPSKFYFVCGLICSLWSAWVFTIRLKHRPVPKDSNRQHEPTEQA